jgi:hypothetical protein
MFISQFDLDITSVYDNKLHQGFGFSRLDTIISLYVLVDFITNFIIWVTYVKIYMIIKILYTNSTLFCKSWLACWSSFSGGENLHTLFNKC